MKDYSIKFRRGCISLACFILLGLSSCGVVSSENTIQVSWLDADGTIIERINLSSEGDFKERELPNDTDEWHYTNWKSVYSENKIICVAQRVPIIKYFWLDDKGNTIKEANNINDDEDNAPELPISNEKWEYVGWEKSVASNTVIYTANCLPNKEYFLGNVFQIVLNDEKGVPISTGSGFIIDEEGWFITNNHVMEGGASAIAYFDIEDAYSSSKYVHLSVAGCVYNSKEKDIFIGKLEGYDKLSNYYHDIDFIEEYQIGEKVYSIGYPNSSLYMKINKGVILDEYLDIYNKINESYYILSDSYIAPGSSGGILINENFEVVGITSMGLYEDSYNQVYIAGGSIPTSLFSSCLNNLNELDLKLLTEIYN